MNYSDKHGSREFLVAFALSFLVFAQTTFSQTYLDPNASADDRSNDLVAIMTLDEKIGQMTLVADYVINGGIVIRDRKLGAFLTGAGNEPGDGSNNAWADFSDQVQSFALQTRLQIPILHGIDAVHGHNSVDDAVIFPHNIGLGCIHDLVLIERIYEATAIEVSGTGTKWTFAPCIAVSRDERWGRTYESFSENTTTVTNIAKVSVLGLQGNDLSESKRVLGCAKHLIADGGTDNGINAGNATLTEAELRAIHLPPFQEAVNQKVGSVMASFSSWNGDKCHGSYFLNTQLLKTELGFEGFVVSDWNGINQLPGNYNAKVRASINAGIDMVMVPVNYNSFIATLTAEVNAGNVSMDRIDDAVKRILKQKFLLGLFENPYTDRSLTSQIGSQAHKDIARESVRKSLVVLKNDNSVLPIAKSISHIHVAGKSADDIGNQCGGWTVDWQGASGDTRNGTTILEAIQGVASGSVAYTSDASGAGTADIGIVVIGETPYAETAGDKSDLNLDAEDIQAVMNMKNQGIPTVVILISGRPMILTSIIDDADAIVAAWLPGSEGEGVTDVIFGDFAPTGKLSFSWPGDMNQIPVNLGDASYSPMYEFGHGITNWENIFSLGDANGDGVVDNLDIADFASALFTPAVYAATYPDIDPDAVLDMNQDGVFNNLDTAGFGAALGF